VQIGRLFISRKLDVIAIVALLLALITAGGQLYSFWSGAKPKLLPPDQVFIWKDTSYTDGMARARFGASLIYVNSAEKGYGAIIRRELFYVTIAGKHYEQGWDEFVTFDGFKATKPNPAKPFSVDGGDSQSHETAFAPWPKRCAVSSANLCDDEENHVHWDRSSTN
jgi:hypothetical protein